MDNTVVGEQEQSGLVQQFCGVTACTPQEALFFLESCNWQLDSALHSFFENNNPPPGSPPGLPVSDPLPVSNPEPLQPAPAPAGRSFRGFDMAGKDKKPAKPGTSRGGIRTLSDLNRPSGSGSDSDSDNPQEYYTGGD